MTENFNKMTVASVAKALHKDRSTVHRWKAAGMPLNPDGKSLCLANVVAWLEERAKDAAMSDQAMNTACDSPALERYRQARAGREELRLEQERGELISHEAVDEQWTARVVELCSALEYLSERLSAVLPGKDEIQVRKTVSDEIWKLRDLYSRGGKYCEANLAAYDTKEKPWD